MQRASDGSHRRAYRIEKIRVLVSLAFGLAAVVASAAPDLAPVVAVTGAVWTLLSFALVAVVGERQTGNAAMAQEQLDTWLFDLPLSMDAAAPIPDEELRRLARGSTIAEERMRTWYPDVTGLPDVFAVLACQRENLTWDWRLRRRFASLLTWGASLWIAAGVSVGLVGDLSVRAVAVRWFVPSTSALILALQLARGHREIAAAKEQLVTLVRDALESARPGDPDVEDLPRLNQLTRDVQGGIYRLRKRGERVPRILYERYRDEDEADMQATVADLKERLSPS